MSAPMKVGAVVITMGNRPEELRALLDSIAKQDGDPVEVVVVGNGSPVPDVTEFSTHVRTVEVPENLGIPGGRNVGIEAFGPSGRDVDVLMFLDDDGLLAQHDTARLCREAFAADPELGIISFRIADPDTGVTQRRHVPRLRAADPMRSSRVTTFLGGANAVRTQVLAEVGALPDEFFYAHEETDLAWRALDAGWMIDYRSDMVLHHPTTAPSRHGRPQPGLAGPAQPPRAPRPGLPRGLAAAHAAAPPLAPGPQGVVRWIPGRVDHIVRTAQAHEVAYGVAADPTGPASRHLTSSSPRAPGRSAAPRHVPARFRPRIPKTKVSYW
jgi:hypothetical protein